MSGNKTRVLIFLVGFFECIGYAPLLKFSIDKTIVLGKFPMAAIQSARQKILIRHQKD